MLSFRADGDLGEIDARIFLDVVSELLRVVRSAEPDGAGDVTWRLAGLREGSGVVLVEADRGQDVECRVFDELETLTTSAEIPVSIPISRIRSLVGIADRQAPQGRLGIVEIRLNGDAVILDPVTSQVMRDRLAGLVETIGSVSGRVETLRAPQGGDWYVSVRHIRTGRIVRCHIPRDPDLLDAGRQSVGRRAIVSGRLSREGIRGPVQEVRQVSRIRILSESGSITAGFGRGPRGLGDDEIEVLRG